MTVSRRQLNILFFFILILIGCGGTSSPVPEGQGNAKIVIAWPSRSRLVPVLSESLRIRIFDGSKLVSGPIYINRPDSSVTIQDIPAKTLILEAVAYPEKNGVGTPVASLSQPIAIKTGETTPVDMNLDSTIIKIDVSPATAELEVGKNLQYSAIPKDAEGKSVLVSPSKTSWTSSNSRIASIDNNGLVQAITPGTVTIQFSDSESGRSGSASLTSVLPPPPACSDPMNPSGLTVGCVAGVATHIDNLSGNDYAPIPLSDVADIAEMGSRTMRFDLRNNWISNSSSDNPTFDFDAADTFINEAQRHSIRVVLILGYAYPDVANSQHYVAPISDPYKARWAKYVTAVRDHYRSEIAAREIILSVWNEPLDQTWTDWGSNTAAGVADAYMQVLQATSNILHDSVSGISNAILAAPVTDIGRGTGQSTIGTKPFLERCKAKGLLNIPNLMIDIHPGGAPMTPEDPAEGNIDFEPEMMSGHHPTLKVNWLDAMDIPGVKAMFPNVPILISEWAFNCGSKHNQTGEMVRSFLCAMNAGVSIICTYQYREWRAPNNVYEKNHGLVDLTGQKTASWYAYQRFVASLRGFRVKSGIQIVQPGRFRMEFQDDKGTVKVVTWAVKGYETDLYPRMPLIQ